MVLKPKQELSLNEETGLSPKHSLMELNFPPSKLKKEDSPSGKKNVILKSKESEAI